MNNITSWFCKLSDASLNELQWAIVDELCRRKEEHQKCLNNQTLTPEEKELIKQRQYVPSVKAVRERTKFSLADAKYVVDRYLSLKSGRPFTGYSGLDDEGNPVTREELKILRGE